MAAYGFTGRRVFDGERDAYHHGEAVAVDDRSPGSGKPMDKEHVRGC